VRTVKENYFRSITPQLYDQNMSAGLLSPASELKDVPYITVKFPVSGKTAPREKGLEN
jgi:hypothetical protein